MLVGVDFDNTIVCYDSVFHKVAVEKKLIPKDLPVSKGQVRDYLRQKGQEDRWTELQGYVYGDRMQDAAPFPGVLAFFSWCREQGISVRIISHRTRKPFRGPQYDLHQAANVWIRHYGFYERMGLSPEHVHFELTRKEKLDRIGQEDCDMFIDDLPEILAEPGFPANVESILFDPNKRYENEDHFQRATSWKQIMQLIMKRGNVDLNKDIDELYSPIASLLIRAGFKGDFEVHPLQGGFNNRVFRIDINGSHLCLKVYFQHPDDPRDRMNTEFSFAKFAWNKGIRALPHPLVCDKQNRLALYEFIPKGRLQPKEVTRDMVEQALSFYCDLNRFKDEPEANFLPRASESCFSIASHLELVKNRIDKLLELKDSSPIDREAIQFIRGDLVKTWNQVAASVKKKADQLHLKLGEEIERFDWCLSPSDFGFHNVILADDGKLHFLDFEYAGWDDPAKMVCDFFCQPAVPAPFEYFNYFLSEVETGLSNPDYFKQRVDILFPVYRIKWCCIMLNEFLVVDGERRKYALNYKDNREIQLHKARKALPGHG